MNIQGIQDILAPAGGSTELLGSSPFHVALAVLTSFGLATVIAFVYRWTHRGKASQGYVHTLIMMCMITTVVIMVVGGSMARAFAVFGAFSMIRFRNALPDTRDVGFIFFAMVVGMAVGAERYDLALVACVLVCAVVLALSRVDLFSAGPTQTLKVRMACDGDPSALTGPLGRFTRSSKLLSVESVQAGLLTEVSYAVRVRDEEAAHRLVSELRELNGNNRILLLPETPGMALAA